MGFANPRQGLVVAAGSGSITSGVVSFANSGGVSWGASASASSTVITASAAAGLPAIQSISAGTTLISSGEVILQNSNIVFGMSGQTVTAHLPTVLYWNNNAQFRGQTLSTDSNGTNLWLIRESIVLPVSATRADLIMSGGSTISLGFYTMSGSTASLASSGSVIASDPGAAASFYWKSVPITLNMSAGDYLIGLLVSSGNAARVPGDLVGNVLTTTINGTPGGGTYAPCFENGMYSIGVSGLPASINLTDIVNSVRPGAYYVQVAGG